jgi:hypothetical protein
VVELEDEWDGNARRNVGWKEDLDMGMDGTRSSTRKWRYYLLEIHFW